MPQRSGVSAPMRNGLLDYRRGKCLGMEAKAVTSDHLTTQDNVAATAGQCGSNRRGASSAYMIEFIPRSERRRVRWNATKQSGLPAGARQDTCAGCDRCWRRRGRFPAEHGPLSSEASALAKSRNGDSVGTPGRDRAATGCWPTRGRCPIDFTICVIQ